MASATELRPEARTLTIQRIVEEVENGHFRVPAFQRPLRWRSKHVIEFLDSIRRGFPIGDLLLSEGPVGPDRLHYGARTIDATERPDGWMIVDGQQRVAALGGVFLHPDSAPRGDIYAIWYDLKNDRFLRNEAATPSAALIPASVLVDSVKLLTWLDAWPLRQERRDLFERALEVSRSIREYMVPVYVLRGATEDTLRLIFKRSNTAGIRMREEEVFDALHSREGEQPLAQTCDRLSRVGYGSIDRKTFLRILRAAVRPESYGSNSDEAELLAASGKVEVAFLEALRFLHVDAQIPRLELLPYRFPLYALTRFFLLHPKPTQRNRTLLTRWVWRGAVSGHHNDTSDAVVRDACLGIEPESQSDSVQHLIDEAGQLMRRDHQIDLDDWWNARSAATRMFGVYLWSLRPLSPVDGTRIEPGDEWSNVSELVASPFVGRKATALGERIFRPAEVSLTKSGRRDWRRVVADASPEVLATHALTSKSAAALNSSDSEEFTRIRIKTAQRPFVDFLVERTGTWQNDRPAISEILSRAVGQ